MDHLEPREPSPWEQEFSLSRLEALSLFVYLSQNDENPDSVREQLINRIQKMLFEYMTVEEMSNVNDYYNALKGKEF